MRRLETFAKVIVECTLWLFVCLSDSSISSAFCKDDAIRVVQQQLANQGHNLIVDGLLGPRTTAALRTQFADKTEAEQANRVEYLEERIVALEENSNRLQLDLKSQENSEGNEGEFSWNDLLLKNLNIGILAIIIAVGTLRQHSRRNFRETTLKCLDGYLKVYEDRVSAEGEENPKKKLAFFKAHFRGLLDLQWAEMFLWQEGVLDSRPYELWLKQRRRDYFSNKQIKTEDAFVSYKSVWDELAKDGYWEHDDTFYSHMNCVHQASPGGVSDPDGGWTEVDNEVIRTAMKSLERKRWWHRFSR